MNYNEALEYLNGLGKFGINLGLSRISRLLELMGNPERCYKTIHITGTNGKGSVTAMVAAILQASGIKSAMYISPHLEEYTERMSVNGRNISQTAFAEAVYHTSNFVRQMAAEGWEHPTEFEVLTAAAFYHFAAAGVEYAVIEVGLGGLLDSTNVIIPAVTVITNVALEHTDRCGHTVIDIARHKAGIIKPGIPVVTAAEDEALDVITQVALDNNAALYVMGRQYNARKAEQPSSHTQKLVFLSSLCEAKFTYELSLLGRHQIANSAMAIMAALIIAGEENRINELSITTALSRVTWPGRFEVVPDKPLIILDGAHNKDGMIALRQALDDYYPGRTIVFILGILQDKDYLSMIKTLVRPSDSVVLTAPLSQRAINPADLVSNVPTDKIGTADNLFQALEAAKDLAHSSGIICVTGSLYLVGPMRRIVVAGQKGN